MVHSILNFYLRRYCGSSSFFKIQSSRCITTQTKDHSALSNSYNLTSKVSKFLINPANVSNSKGFEKLLNDLFRTNLRDDPILSETIDMINNNTKNKLYLTPNAIIMAIDTGGENNISDLGICIYDKLRSSVYKIQINITERKLSRKSSNIENLITIPLQLSVKDCETFLRYFSNFYFRKDPKLIDKRILIVGHNLEKDLRSLRTLKFNPPDHIFKVDTDNLSRHIIKKNGSTLRKLAETLYIPLSKPFHPSINDAYYTLHVLLRLMTSKKLFNRDFMKLKDEYNKYITRITKRAQKKAISVPLKNISHSVNKTQPLRNIYHDFFPNNPSNA
ncbi:hypothetical protein WICMUC_003333 [Wickerhamomyces mucosus]|uniref:Gfd2/YDR514C-like C-terminal domain-containing protein n=1 Tax=Wickerhamomyces mucosus TaxID=1378264 RepID=A0A9P8TDH0_9ASCO|nr:hypothetical protein WICMUC_003333 [Wickerhamomyces mucosus]